MARARKTGIFAGFGAVALGLLALAEPSPAQAGPTAKTFATDAFSIELGRPVCFAVPVSLRDAASCKGLPPAGANDIDTTQVGLIAAGGIRRAVGETAAPGSLPLVGLMQVFQIPARNPKQPDDVEAERVGLDATKAILATLPSEARRTKVTTRIETSEGVVAVRTSVDVDDLAAGTRASFFGHIETATIFARDASYTVVWSGPAGDATKATLARLADDTTKTMRLVPSQRPEPRSASATSAGLLGTTMLPVGGLAAAGVLASALYFRKRRGKGQQLRAELWPVQGD